MVLVFVRCLIDYFWGILRSGQNLICDVEYGIDKIEDNLQGTDVTLIHLFIYFNLILCI